MKTCNGTTPATQPSDDLYATRETRLIEAESAMALIADVIRPCDSTIHFAQEWLSQEARFGLLLLADKVMDALREAHATQCPCHEEKQADAMGVEGGHGQ